MRTLCNFLFASLFTQLAIGQVETRIHIDKNLDMNFPGKVDIDSSERDLIKYLSSTNNVRYSLVTMDSFEIESRRDLRKRLNGLLDGFEEKGIFQTHIERRTDTTIASAFGIYMILTDTSGKSNFKKAQFFYTVQDRRLYALQIIQSSFDSETLTEVKMFFSNLQFFGSPHYKYGSGSTNFTKIFWFIAVIISCGFLLKSIVSKRRNLI